MEDGDSETVEDWASQLPDSLVGVSLVDAPVLFLVVSHKAFRAELVSLRRAALEAAEVGVYSRELVVDLSRRLEFFKLVYNYHSAAEDEVIFLALDAQVKNVAPTYSLEHKSIDDNFNSVFHHFDLLMNRDEDAHIFQELLFSIGTLQAMICQHMQKEEEQVFPLLRKKFTSEEQSQFVWQYMCSVPIILLEDFFPWMSSYLSSDERLDVIHCLKLILPKERLIQEAVVSWIQHKDISSSDGCNVYIKGSQFLKEVSISKDLVKLYPHYEHEHEFKESGQVHTNGVEGPVKGIHLWHAALRREFNQIIEELNQISSSECFLSLSSVIAHIKFVADVMIFYSNSLDTIISPLLNQLANNSPSPCSQLVDENGIKNLQRLLSYKHECSSQLRSFVQMLCEELEALEKEFSKTLITLETEVFPFISNNYTLEMQLWLLYTNLHVMPLGLLRCTITWFSAHLSESQSNSILKNMRVGCPATPKSFTSLLYEWVRIACSGKSSSAKFRQNLEEMFNGRSFYLPKDVFFDDLIKPNLAIEMKKSAVIPSSSVPVMIEERGNLDKFFSQMFKRIPPYQKNVAELNSASLESRPMDFVRYIHRALIKDLEYLVSLSAKLATNVGFLVEFKKRLKLLQDIYQIHSKSEDEIIFPALETKVAIQNVSHSYCIDHKLEVRQFKRTSRILDKISELHDKESNDTKLKHRQLCLKLHDTCLSMHKVLSDHICREEIEIFPSFQKCFSIEEEENVVGHMLGRTRAEILQQMMPWLMGYLTSDEQNAVMSLWFKVSRYTNFTDWLGEWWEDMTTYNTSKVEEGSKPSPLLVVDPMVVISDYLQKNGIKLKIQEAGYDRGIKEETVGTCIVNEGTLTVGKDGCQSQESDQYPSEDEKKRSTEINDRCHNDEAADQRKESQKVSHEEHPLCLNQEELEATIRRVSSDSTLDSQKKSYIIQNLLMSRWIVSQKISHQEAVVANDKGKISDQNPSYRDPLKLTFGCKHYKRNCKLFAPCCNELYTCIRCHDEFTDHAVDRKAITKMMCMKCLEIQPIGPNCTNHSCRGFSMARYYCRTCKLFDDERQIYHCPYCNLCRLGKGLGIDYFHCMKCNACMSKSLFIHICREKCLEDNCPICHEYIFTSSSPVKALPCGHLMHSTCFQDYTCSHYICPICSKSLGDMQVYFGMLDALLAEEKMPEEYSGQIQVILCNDCEKRGTASFHWLYHKCPHCGSYNTRIM